MTDPNDPLTEAQKVRAACVRASAWALIDASPMTDEVLDVARYIETGQVVISPTIPARTEGGADGGAPTPR